MAKSVTVSKNKQLGARKSKVVTQDDNQIVDVQLVNDGLALESSSSDYSLQADQSNKFNNLDFILSKKDFDEVQEEYE